MEMREEEVEAEEREEQTQHQSIANLVEGAVSHQDLQKAKYNSRDDGEWPGDDETEGAEVLDFLRDDKNGGEEAEGGLED